MTVEIGRLAVKLAGRDAGKECLIVEEVKDNLVLIDGNTRRRKCNTSHLELLPQKAKIKKGASHEEVMKALADLGVKEKKKGKYKKTERAPKVKEEKKPMIKLPFKKEEKPKEDKLAPKEEPKKKQKTAAKKK